MRKLLLLLLLSTPAFAAGSFWKLPQPLPNATVLVCPTQTANPCPSPSSIFSDSALTLPIANPFPVGPTGSFGFWVAAGQYTVYVGQPYNVEFDVTLGGSGGGSGTINPNNVAVGSVASFPAAGGSTTVGPTSLTYIQPTLTVSAAGSGNAVLALSGNTSGTSTFTANPVAGTSNNAVTMSNALAAPNGAGTTPSYTFTSCSTCGIFSDGTNTGLQAKTGGGVFLGVNGTNYFNVSTNIVTVSGTSGLSVTAGPTNSLTYSSQTNCAAVGTAANPSVASCTAAPAGSFSCATNASTGTCTVNTTAVTANSQIFVTQRTDTTTGTRLSVTCNTTIDTVQRAVTAVTAATSFTINLGTIAANPECFSYFIIN